MASTIEIEYTDGRKETIKTSMRARLRAEKELGRDAQTMQTAPMLFVVRSAYAQMRFDGKTDLPFEQWMASLDDISVPDAEDDDENF